ncbi:hypothetical protein [Labrenzia sp. CE80]|uniref:hypothetical protein n=1 Tax=Labrenzia sp. CE80 TaxID=1788986 RepID=UPI00129B3398|nr:hypothetical protein [Labrenzia sp. CE80]
MTEEIDHAIAGDVKTIAPAARFIKTPAKVGKAVPKLGQYNREVLEQLGNDQEIFASLIVGEAVISPYLPKDQGAHVDRGPE